MFTDSSKIQNVSPELVFSLPDDIIIVDTNLEECLSASSSACGRLSLPRPDRLTSEKTKTLAKGPSWGLLEAHA